MNVIFFFSNEVEVAMPLIKNVIFCPLRNNINEHKEYLYEKSNQMIEVCDYAIDPQNVVNIEHHLIQKEQLQLLRKHPCKDLILGRPCRIFF